MRYMGHGIQFNGKGQMDTFEIRVKPGIQY